MKIEHLEERVNDYKTSIETVIEKKDLWKTTTKNLIVNTLTSIVEKYDIGWRVQELNWINSNKGVNITFVSFPQELSEKTNKHSSFQFIQGGSLIFSQSYSGDVVIFILFPFAENTPPSQEDTGSEELGIYTPENITEKLIIEKVDEFLKKMIEWEVPTIKNKVGFVN